MNTSIVKFENVTCVYTAGDHERKALDNVDFSLEEGKFVVILGPSGAGKSTLLNMLGGLDSPTRGTIRVCGKDISTLSNNELADYRASTVGFVFQFYNLVPTLTVYENVALVKDISKNVLDSKEIYQVKAAGYFRSLVSESIAMSVNYAGQIRMDYHISSIYTDINAGEIEGTNTIAGKQEKETLMESYEIN